MLSLPHLVDSRSATDENVHRKTTRPRPRNVAKQQERALVVWTPPAHAADVGAESPALVPARETALVVWSPPNRSHVRSRCRHFSDGHSHWPTPALLVLGTSQPSLWYPVSLATERCPLPIAPANSASCGEAEDEPPMEAAPPVTGVSIVPNVVGQLGVDFVFPAIGMAVRCDATAAVAGQQPHHSSAGSRGRTSVTGERRTRNSSRPRSPSPPPRSRGRPQSPLRSSSPATRPVAVRVFPYRPVASSRPLAMEVPPATRPSTTHVREAPFKIDTSYRTNFAKIKTGMFDGKHSACFSRSFGHGFGAPRGTGAAAARTSASQKKDDKKNNMHKT
ncbi:unnamed protein product [Ectocarpus sp. CCAP 1310/34]|nr:unnamed protein product [Ectocarpus sp. CCAP 1310/34]